MIRESSRISDGGKGGKEDLTEEHIEVVLVVESKGLSRRPL